MVEANIDRFHRKIFFNVQGKGGFISTFLAEQKNLGLLKKGDPNTEIINLLYPFARKIGLFRTFSTTEASILMDESRETLIVFFFNGESYLERGKIVTNLGYGPFHLENKIEAFCKGASHVTIWAVWDCSRLFNQLEAGVKGEWSDSEDLDSCVPVVSTYACPVNQILPPSSNFVGNLSKYLRVILERDH